MIKEPLILDSEIPRSWKIKSQIFYLENFFQPEEIYQLATELTRIDPKDPSSHYELYRAKRLNKLPYNGALESAIENDSIYATEFLILAENAKDPEQTVNFLLNASKHLPSDPVIQLRLAHALIDANDHEKAKKLINSLKRMKWSHIYFPEVISSLEKLQDL
jgi:predicted Zn-dependent protease